MRLWDVATGQVVRTLAQSGGLYGLAFSPDGALLAAVGEAHVAWLWNVASGRLLRTLPQADETVAVAFSADGTLLAIGRYDRHVYLWAVLC